MLTDVEGIILAAKSNSDGSDLATIGTIVTTVLAVVFTILAAKNFDPNKWSGRMNCARCGHQWKARGITPPARCPNCRSKSVVTVNR